MRDGLLLFALPGGQKGFSALIGEQDSAALLTDQMFGGQQLAVDAGKDKAVGVKVRLDRKSVV